MSKKTIRLLSVKDNLRFDDITAVTPQEIENINRSEVRKNKNFKKLYCPKRRNIEERTFIIPSVNSGAITGYLFTLKSTPEPHALIIYYHDGGWMLGNLNKCCAVCTNLCYTTGAAVLAVDYRLAPQFKFPIPVEDCYNAFVWASQGARYWRIDPQKVFLAGDCSGANLAAAVCRLARDRKGPEIAGQILIEPITDCRMRTESYNKYKETESISAKDLAFYIKNYQREPKDILDPSFSPLLSLDFSRLPQTLIFSPENDPLFDDATYYEQALKSAEVPVKRFVIKNQVHGFFSYPASEGWEETVLAIQDFTRTRPLESIEFKSAKERRKDRKQIGTL